MSDLMKKAEQHVAGDDYDPTNPNHAYRKCDYLAGAREALGMAADKVADQQVTSNLGVYWVYEPKKLAAEIRSLLPPTKVANGVNET